MYNRCGKMKAFIYTLLAIVFSLGAILIFYLSPTTLSYDYYPIVLLKDRISYNVLSLDGLTIDYSNGILIHEELPHKNLSLRLSYLSLFYDRFSKYEVIFPDVELLNLTGPINYSQIYYNDTNVSFNSSYVKIIVRCNCNNVSTSIENSTTHYQIYIENSSGVIYSLDGNYSGLIKCENMSLKFRPSSFEVSGDLIGNYWINSSRGIFLSNLNYTIIYRENKIQSLMRLRI